MRLFKKFLLAAGLVGLVGSFGLATQAKADAISATFEGTVDKKTNLVTYHYTSVDDFDFTDLETPVDVQVFVGKTLIGTHRIPSTLEPYDAEDPDPETQIDEFSLDEIIANSSEDLDSTIDGKVSFYLKKTIDEDELTATGDMTGKMTPWYLVSARSANSSYGSAKITPDDDNYFQIKKNVAYIVKEDEDVTITATAEADYSFSNWTGVSEVGGSSSAQKQTITVSDEFEAVANFSGTPGPIGGYAKLVYYVKDSNGNVVKSNPTNPIQGSGSAITATADQTITFYAEGTGNIYKYNASTTDEQLVEGKAYSMGAGSTLRFYTKATTAGLQDSAQLTVTVSAATTPKVTTSDFETYITEGYTLEFKAKSSTGSLGIIFGVASDYSDYVDSIEHSRNSDSVTVKVKFKEKLDRGNNNKEIKLVAAVDGVTAKIDSDTNTDTTKKVTVYSRPTASFSTSDRTLSYKVPAKVNTGTTDGKDSDNSDSQTKVSEVKGVKLQVFSGDTSLGTTQTAKDKGTSATIDASTVSSIVTNISSKLSGDTATLKFRTFPCDSSAKYNKNVYYDVSASVYRVEVTYTKADGTTGTEAWYGFEGETIDFSKNSTIKGYTISDSTGKVVFENGKSTATVKISTSTSSNKFTGVLGTKKDAEDADSKGLDRVPKTGQSNVFVYVMVAIVACAVCAGLYVYNKKTKNNA